MFSQELETLVEDVKKGSRTNEESSRENERIIAAIEKFSYGVKKSGVKLSGLVLDLCSGPISIASIYDPDKVVCYEFRTGMVQILHDKGIAVVRGSITDNHLPFRDDSFDCLFCQSLPMAPYAINGVHKRKFSEEEKKQYIKRVIEEIIRVTRKEAIIISRPALHYFPDEYRHKAKILHPDYIIVLDCKR